MAMEKLERREMVPTNGNAGDQAGGPLRRLVDCGTGVVSATLSTTLSPHMTAVQRRDSLKVTVFREAA
jgi:hypothetical protein